MVEPTAVVHSDSVTQRVPRVAKEALVGALIGVGFAIMRTSSTEGGPLPGLQALVLMYFLIAILVVAGAIGLVRSAQPRTGAGLLAVAGSIGAAFSIAQEILW